MKKILVLGGTMFVGRALVERLKAMPEYDLTLFNRGKSNTELFKDVKQIHGNRETEEVDKICDQHWDCIIDFSAYYPVTFEKLIGQLKGKVGRYIFISTISVFDIGKFPDRPIVEEDETFACSDAQKTSKLPDAYGEKKAEMERTLLGQDWLDKIIFRPSFIYGKFDWTERFYYWLYRAKFSDKILTPQGNFNFSLSNADDLTEALLLAIEIPKHQTIYNAISQTKTSLRHVIAITAKAINRQVEIVDMSPADLEKHGIKQSEFPLLVPVNFEVSDKKWNNDFPFQRGDMATTLTEMLDHKSKEGFPKPKVGLDFEKEQQVIKGL
ncbi:MAG: NAD-dependent epimerase/dehydratase family protein [Bacteroidota bacterium]|nr:NAD-dependent epimerase/dehydratase family protein [Bacteroidota bacterium]